MRELKEELEARDQPKTGNNAWLRRRLHGAIVRAHLSEREPQRDRECTRSRMDTFTHALLPFCEMGQTFTVLIRV